MEARSLEEQSLTIRELLACKLVNVNRMVAGTTNSARTNVF